MLAEAMHRLGRVIRTLQGEQQHGGSDNGQPQHQQAASHATTATTQQDSAKDFW